MSVQERFSASSHGRNCDSNRLFRPHLIFNKHRKREADASLKATTYLQMYFHLATLAMQGVLLPGSVQRADCNPTDFSVTCYQLLGSKTRDCLGIEEEYFCDNTLLLYCPATAWLRKDICFPDAAVVKAK